MNQRQRSKKLFAEARKYMPGGVNSPVRAFKAVGGDPLFIAKALGSKLLDVDGNEYIDYVLSWGPMILGHAHPKVVEAIKAAAENGTSYGAPSEPEVKLARIISEAMPSIEMVRMVNSGTEAIMSAIRVARAYTQKEKVLKFEGCYHGHADSLLIRAGSGATTLGIPDSPGVPAEFVKHTLIAPYNDLEAVKKIVAREANNLACVIVEPIAANMGVIPPSDGFLEGLRQITQQHQVLLIFDEVITGFRVGYGGAQGLYRIEPDLTCLGKIIGGGLPVGAYGGKQEIMQMVSPSGPVYQAGTLSGNPVAMSAGIATLQILSQGEIYKELEDRSKQLFEGLVDAARKAMADIYPTRIGSLLCLFFTPEKVINYSTAKKSNTTSFARFFSSLLEEGIYLPPSQFEALFLSTAHTHADIEQTLRAARNAFKQL